MAITNRHPVTSSAGKAIAYVKRGAKTRMVTGIGCSEEFAAEEMQAVRDEEDDERERIRYAYHTIQSFSPSDGVSAEEAHEIGVQLAREVYPGYQCVVATHTDKGHVHNHIISNSVSAETGMMMRDSLYGESSLNRLREVSDRLCREHRLSVRSEEAIGRYRSSAGTTSVTLKRPLRELRISLRKDFEEIMRNARSYSELVSELKKRGYSVKEKGELKVARKGLFKTLRYFAVRRIIGLDKKALEGIFDPHPARADVRFVRRMLKRLSKPRAPQTARILRRFGWFTRGADRDAAQILLRRAAEREDVSSPGEIRSRKAELMANQKNAERKLAEAWEEAEYWERLMAARSAYLRYRGYAAACRKSGSRKLRSRNYRQVVEFEKAEKELARAGFTDPGAIKGMSAKLTAVLRKRSRLQNEADALDLRIRCLEMMERAIPESARYIVARPRKDGSVEAERGLFIFPKRHAEAGGLWIVPVSREESYRARAKGREARISGEELYRILRESEILREEGEEKGRKKKRGEERSSGKEPPKSFSSESERR